MSIITLINDLLVKQWITRAGFNLSLSAPTSPAHALPIQCSTLYCHDTALPCMPVRDVATLLCTLNLQCHVQARTSLANTMSYNVNILSNTMHAVLTCTPDDRRPPPICYSKPQTLLFIVFETSQ